MINRKNYHFFALLQISSDVSHVLQHYIHYSSSVLKISYGMLTKEIAFSFRRLNSMKL